VGGTNEEPQPDVALRLCSKGFIPAEVPPLVQSRIFASHLAAGSFEVIDLHEGQPNHTRTRPTRFSAARLNGLRRVLGIVNPHSFARLAVEIDRSWSLLSEHYDSSEISVSRPSLTGKKRALALDNPFVLRDARRREVAVTSSFRLRTDVAQCYPSMYTHSIPWALHDRATAKAHQGGAEEQVAGGRLDRRVRDMSDGQTSGLPIGPDTSLAMAEIVLTRIDAHSAISSIASFQGGIRNIDDIELYFSERSGADEALERIERAAAELELSLNPHKTSVEESPLEIEDRWKSRVTASMSRSKTLGGTTGFLNEMLALAREFPGDAVVPYGIKVALRDTEPGSDAHRAVIDVALAASRFSAASMKHTIPIAAEAAANDVYPPMKLAHALNLLVERAAQLHRHDELTWAVWGLATTGQRLVDKASEAMRSSTDPLAVTLYHYMREVGLADGDDAPELADISAEDLMTESWLLAYEAVRREWTSDVSFGPSPFFERLLDEGVTFLPPPEVDEPDDVSDWLDDHPPVSVAIEGY
jgi:hypothetical protein